MFRHKILVNFYILSYEQINICDFLIFFKRIFTLHLYYSQDFKPANLMLCQNGLVKITDFGLAATVSASSGLASTMVGTPNSCSPELYRGERYGRPADLWGVGVILFELLTLSTPFTAQNVAALCQQIITAAYDDDALARCPHPDALTHLASRDALFHTDPAARLTLAELVDRLGHVADSDGSGPAG